MRNLLIVLVLLFAVACADPITSGSVVAKDFEPAHIEEHEHTRTESYCGYGHNWSTGKYEFNCNQTREVHDSWHDHHIPDKWTVTFEGENEKGKLKRRTVEVTQGQFNEAFIGQHFAVSE